MSFSVLKKNFSFLKCKNKSNTTVNMGFTIALNLNLLNVEYNTVAKNIIETKNKGMNSQNILGIHFF